MSANVTMPKLGMTMKVGKISKWYKNEGDSVDKGENLFEVKTEKIITISIIRPVISVFLAPANIIMLLN